MISDQTTYFFKIVSQPDSTFFLFIQSYSFGVKDTHLRNMSILFFGDQKAEAKKSPAANGYRTFLIL